MLSDSKENKTLSMRRQMQGSDQKSSMQKVHFYTNLMNKLIGRTPGAETLKGKCELKSDCILEDVSAG
jgi:hypothetical protein